MKYCLFMAYLVFIWVMYIMKILSENQKFTANHGMIARALAMPKTPPWRFEEDASGNVRMIKRDPNERWNDIFVKEPTDYEIQQYLMKLDGKNAKQAQYQKNLYNQIINDEVMACLGTISIDQDYKQVPKLIGDIVALLKRTSWQWEDEFVARAEFYSDVDGKWNPHIHILNKRNLAHGVPPSKIKQALEKKLKGDKYQVYRIDCCARPFTAGENYINGLKKTEKQENVEKDRQYRLENNIDEIYYLSSHE